MPSRKIGSLVALAPALFSIVLFWPALSGKFVPSFRDQSDFFYPSHLYTARRIRHGEIPLWNSLSGNGESWIGNGQNEIFYPPALLFLLANGALACGLFLVFHFFISFLLFFGFVRARGLTPASASLGAAVWSLSGAAVSFSAYWNHFAAMAWIGGMAWAAQLGLKTRRQRAAFSVSLALTLLAGSPEMALFGLILSAVVFEICRREEKRRRLQDGTTAVARRTSLAGAFGAGVALAAVELLPLMDSLTRCARRGSAIGGSATAGLFLSLGASPAVSRWPWFPQGAGFLQSLYLSLAVLALGVCALFLPERYGEKLLWWGVAIVAAGVSCFSFSFPFRFPSKCFALSLFALAILAAEGGEVLQFVGRWRPRLVAGSLLAGACAVGAFGLTGDRPEQWTLVAVGLLFAAAAAGSGLFRRVAMLLGAVVLGAHLALAGFPLVRFAPLSEFAQLERPARGKVLTPPNAELAKWANRGLPNETWKVRRQIDALEGYTNLLFDLQLARTGSALIGQDQFLFQQAADAVANPLIPAAASGCHEVRFPVGDSLTTLPVAGSLSGPLFFFHEEPAPPPARALARINSGHFDFQHDLLVAGLPSSIPLAGGNAALALASEKSARPERLEYAVTLSRPAWLYRSQSWDPWWRATIDGKPARIFRADGVFSAVYISEGEHVVAWRYFPWPFYAGGIISALALLCLIYLWLAGPPLRELRGRA